MSSTQPDDLDALRAIVEALAPFDSTDQERIIRWAREKVGLAPAQNTVTQLSGMSSGAQSPHTSGGAGETARPKDIRTFVDAKNPQSDNQFAATVAYYYRFEAPEAERKMDITADDVQDATRKAGRDRLNKPGQTLLNAHGQGYFDKAERGRYALSTVGENLVAMALPQGTTNTARRAAKAKRRAKPQKKTTKK